MVQDQLWYALVIVAGFVGTGMASIIAILWAKSRKQDKIIWKLQQEIKQILRGTYGHINNEDFDDE